MNSTARSVLRQPRDPVAVRTAHGESGATDARLAAFQGLLLAIDRHDARGAVAVQRRLRALGLSVVPCGPQGAGRRR
jgi:hypothetical protein